MAWKTNRSILLSAAAIAATSSAAMASFQYDLRLAPGQTGAVDPHNVLLNNSSPSTYTLQLWGQITGDTNLNNDGFTYGLVNAESVQGPIPAFTSGGITSVTIGSHVNFPFGAHTGSSGDITHDGVTDWGVGNSNSVSNSTQWSAGVNPGYADGSTDAESHQVDANTWEVLILTYTVAVTGVVANTGSTSINLLLFNNARSGFSTVSTLVYYQDDPLVPSGGATLADEQNSFSITGNVTFSTVPEPASLSLLALGGLALINRRRKA